MWRPEPGGVQASQLFCRVRRSAFGPRRRDPAFLCIFRLRPYAARYSGNCRLCILLRVRPPLTSLSDSELFGRIQDSGLKSIVESTARKSADLLSTVIREMPLFTLHNERHILNVIGWMEELLAPGELVEKMSQFECALCLLAAYTHDLGMTLSAKESVDLENDPDYPLSKYDKVILDPRNVIPVDFEQDNKLFVIPIDDIVAVYRHGDAAETIDSAKKDAEAQDESELRFDEDDLDEDDFEA